MVTHELRYFFMPGKYLAHRFTVALQIPNDFFQLVANSRGKLPSGRHLLEASNNRDLSHDPRK